MTHPARNLTSTITVWEANGRDGAGDPTFSSASPREIRARWEEVDETTFSQEDGGEIQVGNRIYVAEDLNVGDWVFNGSSSASDPTTVDGARQIVSFEKVPNLRGNKYTRVARV